MKSMQKNEWKLLELFLHTNKVLYPLRVITWRFFWKTLHSRLIFMLIKNDLMSKNNSAL